MTDPAPRYCIMCPEAEAASKRGELLLIANGCDNCRKNKEAK